MVNRKFERRRAGEHFFPESAVLRENIFLRFAALPNRVIGVLNLERRKLRGTSTNPRFVYFRKFLKKNPQRPAVRNNVVHYDDENVFSLFKPEQRAANQRPAREIKRVLRFFVDQLPRLRIAIRSLAEISRHQSQRWFGP